MNFYESLPYIAGFMLQGESGLLMWFIHYVNRPDLWKWIGLFAVVVSNISFMFYFFAGYYADRFMRLNEKILKTAKKFDINSVSLPRPIMIISMRFLFLIRNPIAVYLGIRRYNPAKFILYNFAGSLIWIAVWFAIFYSARLGMQKILNEYSQALHYAYMCGLVLWISIIVWRRISKKIFKHKT